MSSWYDCRVWAVPRGMPGMSAVDVLQERERTAATSGPASERVPPMTVIARKVTDAVSVKHARRHEAHDARVQRPRQPRQQRAHDEGPHLHPDHVDAARLGAELAAVQGAHGAARAAARSR